MSAGPLNAPALAELCFLLERPDGLILPDAIWLSGKRPLYQHLRELGAMKLVPRVEMVVTCPGCSTHLVRPERSDAASADYEAYCPECGRKTLSADEVRPWQA